VWSPGQRDVKKGTVPMTPSRAAPLSVKKASKVGVVSPCRQKRAGRGEISWCGTRLCGRNASALNGGREAGIVSKKGRIGTDVYTPYARRPAKLLGP